jgi:hypothetical protein
MFRKVKIMSKIGQVVARKMTPGLPHHVRHISALQWFTDQGTLHWSSRADMVERVGSSPKGTFFTDVNGHTAALYVVHGQFSNWVQTEPDDTKVDNLLRLPLG